MDAERSITNYHDDNNNNKRRKGGGGGEIGVQVVHKKNSNNNGGRGIKPKPMNNGELQYDLGLVYSN